MTAPSEDAALCKRLELDAQEHEHEAARIRRESHDLPRRVERDAQEEERQAADIRAAIALITRLK